MWEEDDEEDEIIIPGSLKADNIIKDFILWEEGIPKYFTENELEFLFRHYQYYSPGDDFRVLKIIELGLEVFPNSGIFQLCQARYYMDKNMLNEAIENLTSAKVFDPMNPEIALLLSECLEEKEQYQQAYEILVEAESFSADFNPEIQIRLASLLMHFERRNEGLVKIASIIRDECQSNEIGNVSTFTFDSEDVLEAVDLLINNEPFNKSYWLFKGHNALFVSETDTAIDAFEYAHYLDEKAPEPLFFLGVCHKENKHYSLARKYFGEASEAGHNKEECIIETAICMNRSGDYAQARFLLQNLIPEEENKFEVLYEIGYSYLHQNEATKALPYLEKSVEISPNLHTFTLLGEVYLQMGDIDDLIEVYKKAKDFKIIDSEFFTCHFFGMFYRAEEFEYLYEIIESELYENSTEDVSLLLLVMKALMLKIEGKNKQYQLELINCFTIDTKETIDLIEKIDVELMHDPEIISIKELF